jgi:sec-independent protein translocase protein TatA
VDLLKRFLKFEKRKTMASLGTPEIILIIVAIMLLFGGKKIPELMRGLGKGVKEFKNAKDGVSSENEGDSIPQKN